MQLRLQRAVEGLSVAAVSYYVVGLSVRAISVLPCIAVAIDREIAIAIAIPAIVNSTGVTVSRQAQ